MTYNKIVSVGYTEDMIFAARQIQEKCKKENMDIYILFVDLTEDFDTVSRTLVLDYEKSFPTSEYL